MIYLCLQQLALRVFSYRRETQVDKQIFKLEKKMSVDNAIRHPPVIVCFLTRVATSGESLRDEGLVRLIGAVVCLLAA